VIGFFLGLPFSIFLFLFLEIRVNPSFFSPGFGLPWEMTFFLKCIEWKWNQRRPIAGDFASQLDPLLSNRL